MFGNWLCGTIDLNGEGVIVHRDGDGFLAKARMQKFLERLGGFNQFCQYCVNGSGAHGIDDCTFANLEVTLRRELGMDCRRVWDGCWAT